MTCPHHKQGRGGRGPQGTQTSQGKPCRRATYTHTNVTHNRKEMLTVISSHKNHPPNPDAVPATVPRVEAQLWHLII